MNLRACPHISRTVCGSLAVAIVCLLAVLPASLTRGQDEPAEEPAVDSHPFPGAVPAPSLDGGTEWFNTGGPLNLKDLRGKFVLLDFWTYCCINCIHILPELKKLEKAYPNEIVVIGVHSAKFDAEQDSKNIREAILRYEIEHPVVNDAKHTIWDKFYVQSWPSLRLIDPQGNFVGGHSGEITFEALKTLFDKAIPYYRAHGLLDETPVHFDLEQAKATADTPLRFPGKILADEKGDRLFISDSNHNRIVITKLDGTLLDTIGSGAIGEKDGTFAEAEFDHPQGMALHGGTLYVADTENHLIRKADLKAKTVTTIAGTGVQGHGFPGMKLDAEVTAIPRRFAGKPLETALNSPWDLLIHKDDLFIAMAGPHQIWRMPLSESEIVLHAGSGREDIIDGNMHPREPYQEGAAAFAQPSGLASDGQLLYVADSEGASIRSLSFSSSGKVQTVIGTAHLPYNRLFTFGDVDGRGEDVRLQHPLGLAMRGSDLYVADTYNNKIKRVDVKKKTCETVAGTGAAGHDDEMGTFDEPTGLAIAGDKIYVADTNNHLIRVIDLAAGSKVSTLKIDGLAPPTPPKEEPKAQFAETAPIVVSPSRVKAIDGKLRLAVSIGLPEGYKVNELAPMVYQVNSGKGDRALEESFVGQPHRVEKPAANFAIDVPLADAKGSGSLVLAINCYYCQEGGEGLCKMKTLRWQVPFRLGDDARDDSISLPATIE